MSVPGTRPRNGFAIAALVLGLLALLFSWTIVGGILLGLLAIIFGVLGRGRAKRGESTAGGLSIVGLVLGVLGLLIGIAVLALGVSFFNSPTSQDYIDCVRGAQGDPARIEQCTDQLNRQLTDSR